MSVINRMLQELEARHEAPGPLPGPVRAVPPPPESRLPRLLVAAALVLVVSGAGWGLWAWQARNVPQSPAPTPAPPPARAPEWPATGPAQEGVSGEVVAAPLPAAPAPAAPAPAAPAPDLRGAPEPPRPPAAAGTPAPSAPPARAGEPATEGVSVKRVSPAQQADQRYREALALLAQQRQAEAEALLKEALGLDPHHAAARQTLAVLLAQGQRSEEAERLLREGLAQPGAPARLAMALARVQLEQSGRAAALATLEAHADLAADDADYAGFHAALLYQAGRHAEAAQRYQDALRLMPERAAWWLGLGLSLEALGRAGEALQAFEHARSLPGLTGELRAFAEARVARLKAQP